MLNNTVTVIMTTRTIDKNTHTCMYIFKKYLHVYKVYTCKYFLNIYKHVCVFIYTK